MTTAEFERYFKQLYAPLGMYALRIIEDVEEAEDVVQECFTAVWNRISEQADIQDFKSYMYRAVRNAALMRMRGERPLSLSESLEEITNEEIDTSERDARLWQALDNLPDRCREIFLLSKRDGLSNAEIASELGISIKTVENQITKAYKALRGELSSRSGAVFFLPFL
jgi:RNA polymerase sigma-70 factor (ECF subfamily)